MNLTHDQADKMTGTKLRDALKALTGKSVKSNNKPYLLRQVHAAIDAAKASSRTASDATFTKLAKPAKQKDVAKPAKQKVVAKPAKQKTNEERDPRLPPVGTMLMRDVDGIGTVTAEVLDDGFEYSGKVYKSLSAIAKAATGTTWNGFLFFKLIGYPQRKPKAEA